MCECEKIQLINESRVNWSTYVNAASEYDILVHILSQLVALDVHRIINESMCTTLINELIVRESERG